MPSKYVPPKYFRDADPPNWLERLFGQEETTTPAQPEPTVAPPTDPSAVNRVPDWLQFLAATGLRVAGPAIGSVVGAPAGPVGVLGGGAAGGAIGEMLAQGIEPGGLQRISEKPTRALARTGVSAALGAVPGSWMVRGGKPLTSAAIGAGLGYGSTAGYKLAEGEKAETALDPRDWSGSEIVLGPVLGGAMGAGFGALAKPAVAATQTDELVENLGTQLETQLARKAGAAASDVGQGGVVFGPETPKLVKAGGVLTRTTDPDVPRVTEAKAVAREADVAKRAKRPETEHITRDPILPKEYEDLASLDEDIQAARDIAKEVRKVNELSRKADAKLLSKEEAADLQELKNLYGSSDLRVVTRRLIDRAVKETTAKEKLAARRIEQEGKLGEKFEDASRKRDISARDEALAEGRISTFLAKEGLEVGPESLTETGTLKVPGGKQVIRQTIREASEEGGKGGSGGGGKGKAAPKPKVEVPAEADEVADLLSPGVVPVAALPAAIPDVPPPVAPTGSGVPPVSPKPIGKGPASGLPVAPAKTKSGLTPELDKEVNQILTEMEAMPYTPRTYVPKVKGGGVDIVPGGAGANVYREILDKAGMSVDKVSRGYVKTMLQKMAAGTASSTKLTRAIEEVAKARALRAVENGVEGSLLPADFVPDPNAAPASSRTLPPPTGPRSTGPSRLGPGALARATAKEKEALAEEFTPIAAKAAKQGVVPFYKSPLEAAGEGYGAVKVARKTGEKVPDAGPASPGAVAARMAKEQKGTTLSAQGAGQLQEMFRIARENPQFTSRLLGAVGGGIVGGVVDEEDPMRGALLGAGVGLGGTVALSKLPKSSKATRSNMPEPIQKASRAMDVAARMVPDYFRASLLSDFINLPINMWVGPWGSAIMGALTDAITLDKRGIKALNNLIHPTNFPKGWWEGRYEAAKRIAHAEERAEGIGQVGPRAFRAATKLPGIGLTAGDIAARNILMDAGYSADEARRMTLTSEPWSAFGQAVSKFKKGAVTKGGKRSALVDMILPFYRTKVNQIEQSMERFPGLGFVVQARWKDVPDPWKAQLAQQFVGGNVIAASYILGTVIPADEPRERVAFGSRTIHKALNNFMGQYGALASAAFAAGQARQMDQDRVSAMLQDVTFGAPLPTMDLFTDVYSQIKKAREGEEYRLPYGLVPPFLDPANPSSIQSIMNLEEGSAPVFPNSRYVAPRRP